MSKSNATKGSKATKAPTGQGGKPLTLTWSDLSPRERRLLDRLTETHEAEGATVTLAQLADTMFRGTGTDPSSTVRNTLRRLFRAGLVTKLDSGCYRATDSGMACVRQGMKVSA